MDALTPQTRIQAAPDVLFSPIGDEGVLLDLKSGVYYSLNAVGASVWKWGVGGRSLGEIQTALHEDFSVDLDVLWADVLALTTDLVQNGLVIAPAPGPSGGLGPSKQE